jgi:hypothetical protein
MSLNGISTATSTTPTLTKILRRDLKLAEAQAKRQSTSTYGYRAYNIIAGTHIAYVNGETGATLQTLSGSTSTTIGSPWSTGTVSTYITRIRSFNTATMTTGSVITTCNEGDTVYLEVEWADLTVPGGENSYIQLGGVNITNQELVTFGPFNALDPVPWGSDNYFGPAGVTGGPLEVIADSITEGNETLTWTWYVNSATVATSSVTIVDTSQAPVSTYTLTPATTSTNEGSSLAFNVTGTNIVNGTYYWTIETNSGDFGTTSGSFAITSNTGTFTVIPTADVTIEGAETFTVAIRSGSITGTILSTSTSITINDTSVPVPPFSLEFSQPQQDYLFTSASADWNLGNNWTMEFWIKANNASGAGINIPGGQWGLINQGGWYGGIPNNSILIGLAGNNLTIAQDTDNDIQFAEPTTQVWTHVAVVNNGGGSAQKVYYNGAEQTKTNGTYQSNSWTNTIANLYIGRLSDQYAGYASHFDGKMAMVRISNTAKYLTAFTPTVTYGVEADTKLFLGSDNPLVDLSTYELNGVSLSANAGGIIYVSTSTYPNLNNQIQVGNTVVNVSNTSTSSVVTGAVFLADPSNWGVPVSPGWPTVGMVNFSGSRHTVTNYGVAKSTSFPQTLTGIVHPYSGGTFGVIYSLFGDPNIVAFSNVPPGARITSNIPNFGMRTVTSSLSNPSGWILTYDSTGLTGMTSNTDVFNFYW